jgi:hypothetical protein
MRAWRTTLAIVGILVATAHLTASGPLGVYGIVEKVVVEPSEAAPERIQVWGAFAYVEGPGGQGLSVSPAKRGYMYFRMDPAKTDIIKKEWADLKAIAGTGQAIGFGQWFYIGGFGALQPDTRSNMPPYILEHNPSNQPTDLRVRPASEPPASAALYQTNAGIVKLSETGGHAAIVKQLKDALKQ